MPRLRPLPYREVLKRLMAHDSRFREYINRGKGSERVIYHPDVNGRPESYPLKHHGQKTDIYVGHLKAMRRRFDLPTNIFR